MERRTVLRNGALVGGLATLAGCAAFVGDGTDGEEGTDRDDDGAPTTTSTTTRTGPTFDAAVRPPGDPRVGEATEVTVAVTNDGDAAGTFEGDLTLTGPWQVTRPVTVEGVAPGESGSATASFTPEYAGTYTARLGSDASAEFTVHPRNLDFGDATGIEGFELSVEEARVEPTVIAEGPGPIYLRGSVPHVLPVDEDGRHADGQVMLVVEASVTNTGEEARVFDPAGLALSAGTGPDPRLYADMGQEVFEGVPLAGAEATLESPPLAGLRIPAGETAEGWLLAAVDRETVAEGRIDLGIQRDGAETAPEVVWELIPEDGVSLPAFETAELSVPGQVPNTTTAEFSLRVTNTGDVPGTFRDVLEIAGNLPELDPVGRITGEVDPGETIELTGEFLMAWGRSQGLRLQAASVEPVSEGEHVDFGAICEGTRLELGFGEAATLTNGVTVRLSSPVFTNGYRYGTGPKFGRSTSALLVAVTAVLPEWAKGQELGKQMLPELGDFLYNLDEKDPIPPLRTAGPGVRKDAQRGNNTLEDPVEGDLYPLTPPDRPSEGTVEGWAEFHNFDTEWPDSDREVLLGKILKPRQGDRPGKGVGIAWSQKFGIEIVNDHYIDKKDRHREDYG